MMDDEKEEPLRICRNAIVDLQYELGEMTDKNQRLQQLVLDLEREVLCVKDSAFRAGVQAVLTRLAISTGSPQSPETYKSLSWMAEDARKKYG